MSVLGSQVDVDMEESVPDPVPKHQGHTGTGCYKLHDHEFIRPRGRPPLRKGGGGIGLSSLVVGLGGGPGGGANGGGGGGITNHPIPTAAGGPLNVSGGAASGGFHQPANLMDLPVSDVVAAGTVPANPVASTEAKGALYTSKSLKNVMSPMAQKPVSRFKK